MRSFEQKQLESSENARLVQSINGANINVALEDGGYYTIC